MRSSTAEEGGAADDEVSVRVRSASGANGSGANGSPGTNAKCDARGSARRRSGSRL